MQNPFQDAIDRILEIVVKHQLYLTKNPKVLAWLMRQYDEINAASRYAPNSELDNPKYALLELRDTVTEKYASLIYAAWGFDMFHSRELPLTKLEWKKNKIMGDFFKIYLDPNYTHKRQVPHRNAVLNKVLCNPYSSSKWNKKGFIDESWLFEDGVDLSIFFEYQKAKIPNKIKKECHWLNNKKINQSISKMKKEKKRNEDRKNKLALKKGKDYLIKTGILKEEVLRPFVFDSLKNTLFSSMPKNAHKSFVEAKKEICDSILNSPNETSENKSIAKKTLAKLK